MEYGFTGSSGGMTPIQLELVNRLYHELKLSTLHHGDCVGADEQAHRLARHHKAYIVGHPPIDPKARAFCACDKLWPEKAYLRRNVDVAKEGKDGLIATPAGLIEVLRGFDGGTWSTIRYARKFGRHIWIVFPDGRIKVE